MDKLYPIKFDLMYRSILGKVDGFRGHRVIIVTGDVIGVPHYPPGPEALRTLTAMSLALAQDSRPAIRVYFSTPPATSGFDPPRSNKHLHEYFNSTFVIVRQADNTEVVAINLIALEPWADVVCPEFTSTSVNYVAAQDAVFQVALGDATVITSIVDGEAYVLTEGQHYTFVEGVLTISDQNYVASAIVGGTITLTVSFDVCPSQNIEIIA